MTTVFQYWTLIGIDASGGRRSSEIAPAKAFFRERFPQFSSVTTVTDAPIQRWLLQKFQAEKSNDHSSDSWLAALCLRCFISTQIEFACIQLEAKFGQNYGFTRYDLFPFVLTDVITAAPSPTFTPIAIKILHSFNPDRSSLSTWTNRLVKHDQSLNSFLLERGVYLISDWALLNDMSAAQVRQILKEFHSLTQTEIDTASILLESYRAVYLRDRLQQSPTFLKKPCPPPTPQQLQEIATNFYHHTNQKLPALEVMLKLQDLAELLRQYRIYIKGGSIPIESLDRPLDEDSNTSSPLETLSYQDPEDEAEFEVEFLQFYRQQFLESLDKALEQVIHSRLSYFQRKSPEKAQQFLTGLCLFHRDRLAMAEIARRVGLQEQYQVSRLLKLNEFRTDVRQLMLKALLPLLLEKAKNYTEPQRLQKMSQQIEKALDEQIESVISEAQAEGANPRKHHSSLFTERLCYYLNSAELAINLNQSKQ